MDTKDRRESEEKYLKLQCQVGGSDGLFSIKDLGFYGGDVNGGFQSKTVVQYEEKGKKGEEEVKGGLRGLSEEWEVMERKEW